MTDEDKAPEQPAVEQSPENLPAPPGEVREVGRRTGMFGASGSGDTSGYGGLVAPVIFPGERRSARTAAGTTRWPTPSTP